MDSARDIAARANRKGERRHRGHEARRCAVSIRLSESELAAADARAVEEQVTRAEWLRGAVLMRLSFGS